MDTTDDAEIAFWYGQFEPDTPRIDRFRAARTAMKELLTEYDRCYRQHTGDASPLSMGDLLDEFDEMESQLDREATA